MIMWPSPSNRPRVYILSYATILVLCAILCSTSGFHASPVVPASTVSQKSIIQSPLAMSSQNEDQQGDPSDMKKKPTLDSLLNQVGWNNEKRPPIQVDDTNLLFYDIFLILNLCASISFWVVHRMDLNYIGSAFNEGCLMSIMWIGAGLYTGAFLYSAVDGHYSSGDERGGPKAAGLLGFHTFLNAVNLRLVFALVSAVIQHRPVGSGMGEDLLPIEIGFGMVLMGCWRLFHSTFVPRI